MIYCDACHRRTTASYSRQIGAKLDQRYLCAICFRLPKSEDTTDKKWENPPACMECDEITPLNRRIYCDDPKDGYNCVSCHNRLVLEEDKVNEVPTLEDVKYAKLRLRMQGLAQLLKLNSQFLLKHSRITKNEVIHGVDVSYAAAQIRIYEIIEHDLDEIEAYKGDAREPCAFYQSPKSPEGVEG